MTTIIKSSIFYASSILMILIIGDVTTSHQRLNCNGEQFEKRKFKIEICDRLTRGIQRSKQLPAYYKECSKCAYANDSVSNVCLPCDKEFMDYSEITDMLSPVYVTLMEFGCKEPIPSCTITFKEGTFFTPMKNAANNAVKNPVTPPVRPKSWLNRLGSYIYDRLPRFIDVMVELAGFCSIILTIYQHPDIF